LVGKSARMLGPPPSLSFCAAWANSSQVVGTEIPYLSKMSLR